jgi:hypothetical protein
MSKKIHLSASAIKCFKACPLRFYGTYDQGIRRIIDTESQRMGTNWHSILELNDPNDMSAVIEHLNDTYGDIPDYMDKETLEIERIKLLYSLTGYNWFYQDKDENVLATEIEFKLPLLNPETGRALPNVIIQGKIDKFVQIEDRIYIKEHKSTSSSVDPDSRLWKALGLDTQTNLYVYVARKLQFNGELDIHGIFEHDPPIAGVYYDVWHKPQISPKKLSQADSKKFVETGEYCKQKFEVKEISGASSIHINNIQAEVEPGKKEGTFAIRETPEMYGARLLADIVERPEFYFACKELVKTDQQMERFEWELYNIYKTIRNMKKTGHWYGDESQCEATFTCDFIENCYNNIPIDLEHIPDGMECIYNKEINNGK